MAQMSCNEVEKTTFKSKWVRNTTLIAYDSPDAFLILYLNHIVDFWLVLHFNVDNHKHFIHVNHIEILVNIYVEVGRHVIINLNRSLNSIFLFALLEGKDNNIIIFQIRDD